MKSNRLLTLLFALLVATSLGPHAIAHEQKAALTDIFYNERTGNLEIAHRFSLHDAEHTLHKVTNSKADLVQSPEAQAAFAKYVAEHFSLWATETETIKLTMVGQEVERGYLWVYQETKIPKPNRASFSIENTILQDAVKGQINTVNVRFRSKVATFVFEAGAGRKLYAGPDKELLRQQGVPSVEQQ